MSCKFKKLALRFICCLTLLLPAAGISAAEEKISLNFVNADIEEVIRAVSRITGRNFLVDPRVKGTINITSSTPIPSSLAYDILLSALRLQGFASVESGGVTKVMPEADAKLHIESADSVRTRGDRLVTRVFSLKYESAAQLVPILRPLIAPNNVVIAYQSSNTLVVTDYASNLKRISQIVEAIDRPSSETPVVIPLKRASAVEMAQSISRLMQEPKLTSGADTSQRFILVADARTNSLVVRSENPEYVMRVRELVEKLDVETGAAGNIHVVYLKNAEATKMAQILRSVITGDASSGASGVAATTPTQGGTTLPSHPPSTPSGGGMIQADTATNALIITAPDAIYNNLRAVIEKLDVRRAQVFVEALIVEMTAEKAAEFGIQWQTLSGTNTLVGSGTNFGGDGTNILNVGSSIVNKAPVIDNGLNIGVLRGQNLGVLARALEIDANANILSTPNLLTLDNEEAKITIGQNVPFITGSYAMTGNAATATPFQTIERKDVGLTLRIKPQVSEGGTVKLQIFQEVSSVQEKSISNAAGVVTNKRSLESSVLADEGQIIVLGGLIQDSVSNGEDKVPLLGDIPGLGALFRYEKRQHIKTNLMVFIRPYVLHTAADTYGLTQDRYDYLRGEQGNTQLPSRPPLPNMPAPKLPELSLKDGLPQPTTPVPPHTPEDERLPQRPDIP